MTSSPPSPQYFSASSPPRLPPPRPAPRVPADQHFKDSAGLILITPAPWPTPSPASTNAPFSGLDSWNPPERHSHRSQANWPPLTWSYAFSGLNPYSHPPG